MSKITMFISDDVADSATIHLSANTHISLHDMELGVDIGNIVITDACDTTIYDIIRAVCFYRSMYNSELIMITQGDNIGFIYSYNTKIYSNLI